MGISLLAQLYPYFKGSQEDVATTSLQFIISSNDTFSSAFVKRLSEVWCVPIEKTFKFECQVTGKGEEKERPDMSGFDSHGDEKILCESKFFATLTKNQPNTYIKRLIKNKGIGLIFICPINRKISLWNEVNERIKGNFTFTEISESCIDIDGVRVGITSWTDIIKKLEEAAHKNNLNLMDVGQLKGFCEQIESEAFEPFIDGDFGIDNAIKYERHAVLMDYILDSLRADNDISIDTTGLKATPQRTGYTRYFKMNDFCISLSMNTRNWKNLNSCITPYWIRFCKLINNKWIFDDGCKKAISMAPSELVDGEYLALKAPLYVSLDEVSNSMKKQIKEYLTLFEEAAK